MNREQAQRVIKNLDCIKALAEGKTIQVKFAYEDKWSDTQLPQFKDGVNYRIKPEPRKVWIWENKEHKIGGKLITHVYDEKTHLELKNESHTDLTVGWNIYGPFELKD